MLETKDLYLDKGKMSDAKSMWREVWSQPACAQYMCWRTTESLQEAKARMERTIAYQKEHDTYLIYEKKTGKAIGFAGVEKVEEGVYQEAGICLGVKYQHQGLGKQVLEALLRYCRQEKNARVFLYQTRSTNKPSVNLAKSFHMVYEKTVPKIDPRTQKVYDQETYRLEL